MKVFASWSGGKDSALAAYKAIALGHEVLYLLNSVSENGQVSASHGIKAGVIALQAEAIGIPLFQMKTSWSTYEANFKQAISQLKERGITGGVFGDIYLTEHREWIERVCRETGIEAIFPLWGHDTSELIHEFMGCGFKSIIVASHLEESLLGQTIDKKFLQKLVDLRADPCGEKGEYHSFVIAGPLFKKQFEVIHGKKEKRDGVWFLDISVEPKPNKDC